MQQGNQTGKTQGQDLHSQGIYPVSDHDYNLISALANELQGLEKYYEYSQNAGKGSTFSIHLPVKRSAPSMGLHGAGERPLRHQA